ncbi:hypothetical protein D3C84_868640 [compost metagenome]
MEKPVWRPRLLEAYRTGIVTEALRLAQSQARQRISTVYHNVRNWQRYYDEHHYRMSATGRVSSRSKGAALLLDIAAGSFCYTG